MDVNYGCDISNRYTAYLDSSDHGNSMSLSTGKKKRKNKKKRKSKKKQIKPDKGPNTIEVELENNGDVSTETSQPATVVANNQIEQMVDNNERTELEPETIDITIDGLSSLPSCSDSSLPFDSGETTTEHNDMNAGETRWSVLCFEEEKNLLQNENSKQTFENEPEMVFKEQRIYPTVYFYNSKFGNKSRRVVYNNYPDQNRRHQNNTSSYDNNIHAIEEKENRHRNRNKRHKRKFKTNDKMEKKMLDKTESVDEKHPDNQNESLDRTSQWTNESKKREDAKNYYNKTKHGIPDRTFTRRRTDYVRNV